MTTDESIQSVESFLAQFGEDRARAVHLALLSLRDRSSSMLVTVCELAYEVHDKGHWHEVKDEDGKPYETEESYFEEILQVGGYRSAAKRIAVGRMLATIPEAERDEGRHEVEQIGIAKASVLAPMLENLVGDRESRVLWFRRAHELRVDELQKAVSAATRARSRGVTPIGSRFRSYLLNAMPDLEAQAVCERLLEVGAKVTNSDNPVGIVLAAFQEALSSWEPRVGAAFSGTIDRAEARRKLEEKVTGAKRVKSRRPGRGDVTGRGRSTAKVKRRKVASRGKRR